MVFTLVGTALGLLVGGAALLQLVGSVSVLIDWVSLALASVTSVLLFYNLVKEQTLLEVFDTEIVAEVAAALFSAVIGFVAYRLFLAVLSTFGIVLALVIGVVVVLSIAFSPAFVGGGLLTIANIGAEIVDILRGEN